jgi:hypothetical protein
MKSETPDRSPSLASALGMPCALLSLASGLMSLIVAFLLWWGAPGAHIRHIGEQAGVFSALVGLVLAGIGMASGRKRVRRLAIAAIIVNLAILSFTFDSIFMLIR